MPKQMLRVKTAQVGEVVQSYVDEGYTDIECIMVDEDNWTIRAS